MTESIESIQDADRMFSEIKKNFESSINEYREHMQHWVYGWAMEMEQKIIVNNKSYVTDLDDNEISASVTRCPLDGKITLVHCFEAQEYVPIANTAYTITVVEANEEIGYNGIPRTTYTDLWPKHSGNVDANGFSEVELSDEFKGKLIRVVFNPDVNDSDVKGLIDSYDPTIAKLSSWLESQWETQRQAWGEFINSTFVITDAIANFLRNMLDAVIDAWDEIANLFKHLANPSKLTSWLKKYVENPELIAETLSNAKEESAKMLMMLTDEARCFLCLNAVWSYFMMLTPIQIGDIVSVALASILVEVVISLVVPGGVVLRNMNRLREIAGISTLIEA